MSIEKKFIKIGIVSISDRASKGIYLDLGVNDEVWATSDPDGLVVQVMDIRKED